MNTDERLAEAVGGGDDDAFDELLARHYPSFLRFAVRQLGERTDAEEILQDAFLRAYRALRRGRPPQRFRPWMMRIVINRCRSFTTARTRRRRLHALWSAHNPWAGEPSIEATPDLDELDPRLTRALAALPPLLREAFLLKHIEELEYEEMAAATGAGVSALKMRVKRATSLLAKSLESYR